MRIITVDDHEVVRQGLRSILETQPGWSVVGEAGDGREAVERAGELRPDIMIMDISMPCLNGLEATHQILKNYPEIRILVLTLHDNDHLLRQVLASGARGYLLKSDASRELIIAVEALSLNRVYFSPKVTGFVLNRFADRAAKCDTEEPASPLTSREREVVQLVAEGKSNKEAAGILKISVKTVETHRKNIMDKLGLTSVSDVVRYAIRNHIIES
jgi:DNA-binding NarL/FixJ family response regulator